MKDTYNANALRNILLNDVQDRLIKLFTEDGFDIYPLTSEEKKSKEMKIAFPFGRLKRKQGEKLEIAEIQFDKYGKLKFIINFGVVPENGVTLPWTHISQQDADVAALSEAYRLYSSSIWSAWFSVGWLAQKNVENVKKTVDKAINLYPEIENWFSTGTMGKHMRKFGFSQ